MGRAREYLGLYRLATNHSYVRRTDAEVDNRGEGDAEPLSYARRTDIRIAAV